MAKKREMWELKQMQALPLKLKIRLTQQRIREWVNEFGLEGVYVSFSGGKDSTVLLHIARQMFPEIKAVFSNTGLEFPETVKFVETFENVDIVHPKMSYMSVIKKYGYPLISKEVSECVWGARKYLTSVIEQEILERTNEQTNERTNERTNGRNGITRSTDNFAESENTIPVRMGQVTRTRQILHAIRNAQKTDVGGWRSQTI